MISPEYVEARRVLLDALEALGGHRSSVILVGAQAVYMRAGAGDLRVAPYTTDSERVSCLVLTSKVVRFSERG